MTPGSKVNIPAHVVAKSVGDETVLLDLENGTYFGLNALGTRIFKLLEDGSSVDEIKALLVTEFDVEPDTLMADVSAFLDELTAKKLVEFV